MPGLVRGIHVLSIGGNEKDVDGRDKPGHDELPGSQMLKKLAAVTSLFVALCLAPSAHAADYPTHPVTLVVAFTPGGPSDVLARIVGRQLENILGQTFVIDNRPGGAGNIAAETVAQEAR